jgi:hypothetical protein
MATALSELRLKISDYYVIYFILVFSEDMSKIKYLYLGK